MCAGIVEVGQGAFFQIGFVAGLGDNAIRVAGDDFRDSLDPLRWIQPVVAKFIQSLGGC